MTMLKSLFLLCACALSAAVPPPPKTPVAPLLPGESLAVAGPDGTVYVFGDAAREEPMGNLAHLVWLKLEGSEWSAMAVQFNCTGTYRGYRCWQPKGHGKVDLAKALQENCDLAILGWGQASAQEWLSDYGEGAARARMEDAFGPFLGDRLPPGEGIPELTPAWVGDGDLLRTSPEAMLRWLLDPAQEDTVRLARRLLLSFRDMTFKDNVWWVMSGNAPALAGAGPASAWAVGGNGKILAVLHLPGGKGRADGLARFRAVMMVAKGQ